MTRPQSWSGASLAWRRELRGRKRRHTARNRRARRAPLARRRGPSLALPAGADAGQEDGQGDDLLAGAVRLHARQLDADPARPLRVRQVRQARRRLQRRLAGRRRSARSCAPPASTTSRCSAPATSARRSRGRDIFADHGFRVVAIFDTDQSKIGEQVGDRTVRSYDDLERVVEEEDIVVGVLAVPAEAAQEVADDLVEAGVKIIFNYSEALLQVPPRRDGPHVQPGGRPALRALLLPAPRPVMLDMAADPGGLRGLDGLHASASRRSSQILDPETLAPRPSASRSCATPPTRTRCSPTRSPAS